MYNSFTEEARNIIMKAKVEMMNLNHPYIGSEHLLLAILNDDNEVSKKLEDYGLTYLKFKEQIISIIGIGKKKSECFLYTPLLKRIIENAMYDSKENNNGNVTISHLFSSLIEEGEGVAIRILIGMNIDLDELYHEFSYKFPIKKNKNKKLIVSELGINLTKMASENKLDPVYGRENEIKSIIEILCRRKKNNPLLIGEAGVGKTAIVEELSRLISIGDVPQLLKNKKVYSLNMSSLVAGTKYRGEFEEKINKLLLELESNDDIILFIDEIHTLVGAGGAEGAIDASNIFKPALARNKLKLIGATTTCEYKKYIANDKALDRRFQKININIPDDTTTINILLRLKDIYSNYHKVKITDDIIKYIVKLSSVYIKNRYNPDKSIDILDEVCAHVSTKKTKTFEHYELLNKELEEVLKNKKSSIINKNYILASKYKDMENEILSKINKYELNNSKKKYIEVTKKDVIEVLSKKANIPIYVSNDLNCKSISKFKSKMKKTIFGQNEVINSLLDFYKKFKLGFKDNNSCYSLMFVGPTGVGKTMLAKKFASEITNNIIKLDMSEFSEANSVNKLIGSPAGYVGYKDNKNLFESLKENPFSVIIFDEIDKANQSIINLLYQVLDEGILKDSSGEEIYFNNCIIIMTTNVGYETKNIGFNEDDKIHSLKESFSLPFINRIDEIYSFNYLNREDILNIVKIKLEKIKQKYLNDNISININKLVINQIVEDSNYNEYGARKIDRIMKSRLEPLIIDEILSRKKIINIRNIKKEKVIN